MCTFVASLAPGMASGRALPGSGNPSTAHSTWNSPGLAGRMATLIDVVLREDRLRTAGTQLEESLDKAGRETMKPRGPSSLINKEES